MKTSVEDMGGDGFPITERTTLCSYCRPMASRSFTQLHNRKRTMAAAPHVEPYRCTKCGSSAWATTTEMIDFDKPPLLSDSEPTLMWWLLGASSLTILIALLVVWFAR